MFGSLQSLDDDIFITTYLKEPWDYKGEYEEEWTRENRKLKITKKIRELSDDVIIHKIFAFAEIEVNPKKKFQLYGYFKRDKRDKSRRVFFLFKSLWIRKGFPKYMDWKGIRHLVLELRKKKEEKKLAKLAKYFDFSHLRTLKIYCNPEYFEDICPYVIFKHSSFDELRTLLLNGLSMQRDYDQFGMNPMPNLRRLTVKNCYNINDMLFTKHEFPKLEHLKLEDNRGNGKNWCKFSKIKKLLLSSNDSLTDELFSNDKSISPFLTLNHLEKLKLSYCKKIIGEGWMETPNLKILILFRVKQFKDTFFEEHRLEKLEILKCESASSLTGKNWICEFKNLKLLYIRGSKDFEDEFFQKHEMLKLKKLGLVSLKKITGKNWKYLPCLEKFLHGSCDLVDDEIMKTKFSNDVCKKYRSDYHVGINGL